MSRPVLRTLVCCSLLAFAAGGELQAQPAAAALPDFTGIVQQNAPAVVHVEAKYTGKAKRPTRGRSSPSPNDNDPGGDDDEQMQILRRFFGMPMPSPQEQEHTSLGSGFIISPDGYVLTNNHVVDDADEVTVRLQDHRTLTAKVVGTDAQYDIALLKVNDGGKLPAVSIGDSRNLKPGQWVLAIGSPFGFDYTVTQGIVSAIGRNLGSQDQPYTSFIQTDVPINRGNSGGPLFDLQGRVVGINSQIYSSTGGYQGVAFSIPIDVAMSAVQQIKAKGYVTRGQLGVHVQGVTDDMVKAFKLPNDNGGAVVDVSPGSGAEKAGLRPGDIILAYNGQPIYNAQDLPPVVSMTKPGSTVPLEILRDGKKQAVQVTIGEASRDQAEQASTGGGGQPGPRSGSAALGLTVEEVDSDTRQQLGLKGGEGVSISNVNGAAAARAGLQQGDVILMVNQQRIGSTAAFREATRAVKPGDTVLLLVRRGDASQFVSVTVPGGK